MFITIIIFIIVLSILVFVHELGHFWTARKFGVRAEEFGFGFPPRVFGIYKSKDNKWKKVRGSKEVKDAGDTIFSLNWIHLGGFVKLGEDDLESDDPNHFINKPIWQRSIIISAGVTMNVILAAFLISIGLMAGLPQTIDESLNSQAQISEQKVQVAQVVAESPASVAGLETGDIIMSINGQTFLTDNEVQEFVSDKSGEELVYKIKRGQDELDISITAETREETGQGGVGIAVVTTALVKYPFFTAVWEGIKTTILLTWFIIVAFYELIKGLILGHGISIDLGGPVRIAQITGQAAEMGFIYLVQFTALLSINLAVINFLPFPALDGGRVLFLIIEKIKGSPVKKEIEAMIHNTGFMLLMILILLVTFRDVARVSGIFRGIWERIF